MYKFLNRREAEEIMLRSQESGVRSQEPEMGIPYIVF